MEKYAILIPYRNREENLKQLLNTINKKNNDSYEADIYILEQENTDLFNRGRLLNSGFKILLENYDYFIVHDVDLIPEDFATYRHKYNISTHLSCYCSQFNYKLLDNKPYEESEMFGGIVAFPKKEVIESGGFSNIYEGWGCEDNDLFKRIKNKTRFPWKYFSQGHERNQNDELNPNLYNNLVNLRNVRKNDDYKNNNFTYVLKSKEENIFHFLINFENIYPKCVILYKNNISFSKMNLYLKIAYKKNLNVIIINNYVYDIPKDLIYYYSDFKESCFLLESDKILRSWRNEEENVFLSDSFVLVNNDIKYYILYKHDINKLNISKKVNHKTDIFFDKFISLEERFEILNYHTPVITKSLEQNVSNNLENIDFFQNNIFLKSLNEFKTRVKYYNLLESFDSINYYFNYEDLKIFDIFDTSLEEHYCNNGIEECRTFEDLYNKKYKYVDWYYYFYLYNNFNINNTIYYSEYDYNIDSVLNKNHDDIKTVIFTHPGGGGVEKYLKDFTKENPDKYLIIRPNSQTTNLLQFEKINNEIRFFHEEEIVKLHDLLLTFNIKNIIINHLFKFNTIVFTLIKNIIKFFDPKIKVILHDFSFINENPNPENLDFKVKDNVYIKKRLEILRLSNDIISPSEFIRLEYIKKLEKYNDLVLKLKNTLIVPHDFINFSNIKVNKYDNINFKILVYGHNKGIKIIDLFLSENIDETIKLYYYGKNDLTNTIERNINKEYNDSELYSIINEINPHIIWFPSTVPESYCYALTFAINIGFPIVCYNIGAFPERLNNRNYTWLLNINDDIVNFFSTVKVYFKENNVIPYYK